MHDPMVVAFEIRRPWPKISKLTDHRRERRGFRGAFWYAAGYEIYWPGMITVWHNEPGGADAFEVCRHGSRWKWHVHHWSIQFSPWQHFRRWAFTRCEWCGGPHRKGDAVNVGRGWYDGPRAQHWWQSESGLYHGDCFSVDSAHGACVCTLRDGGPWHNDGGSGPWGYCLHCGGFRRMSSERQSDYQTFITTTRALKSVPQGERPSAELMADIARLWREFRERDHAA
jgi:hypothetical protein